jgi:hypothetical protein
MPLCHACAASRTPPRALLRTDETRERHNVPHRNTSVWKESVRSGTPTSVCHQCRAESRLAVPAGDGATPPLPLRCREARRLSGAEAGHPGPGRTGVCHNPAGAPHASTGGSVLGAVRTDRRVQPGRGHATPGPGRPLLRARSRRERPLLWGGRSARAPASADAPAPGARQGCARCPRGRAERHGRRLCQKGCAHALTQRPWGDPMRGTWRGRPAQVREAPDTKEGICHG